MRIGAVRSGLVEAVHDVSVVAVADGRVIAGSGDPGDPFFLRSAAKPFQGTISQEFGADLGLEQLAVACGSHGAEPVHVAHVREMLGGVGLDERHLLCPPSRPSSLTADRRLAAAGDREERRVFHNCSGKHAAMLRACVANDWPLTYTDPDHPLQQSILGFVAESTGVDPTPTGIDGCGVPTLRSTVEGLARGFARFATDPRMAEVGEAMGRYPALTAAGGRNDALLAQWGSVTNKIGAMGCIGVAHPADIGLAAKCWSGVFEVAVMAVGTMLQRLGLLTDHPAAMLADVLAPPVLGGGRPVGRFEVRDPA